MMTHLTFAAIYKIENIDGSLIFTDQPSPASKKINIKSANIYSEKSILLTDSKDLSKNKNSKNSTPYKEFSIQHPSNQQKFNQDNKINIQFLIQPHLKKDHHLFLSLDGKTQEIRNDLNVEIYRGEHTIEAWITDDQQKKLANTEKITFFNGKTAIITAIH